MNPTANSPEKRPPSGMEWDVSNDVLADARNQASASAADWSSIPGGEEDGDSQSAFNIDLRRFIIGAWQRRWLAVVTATAIAFVLVMLITVTISHNWKANVTLIKRSHQDLLNLTERDPFKSQDYSLATLLDTLKLPSSMRSVAEDAGLEVNPAVLASAVDVALARESTILNLSVTWSDPRIAADLANRVAEQFIERTRTLVQQDAAEGFDYYSRQLDDAREQARAASQAVNDFRNEHGISDLDTETKVLLEELSNLWGQYNSRLAETEAMMAARERLEDQIALEPEQMIMYTIYRSPLKARLADYEWELQEALAKYTEENPKVVKLKDRIAALERMIGDSNDESVPENTYTQNNKRFQLELRLQEMGDDIEISKAQTTALESTLEEMQDKLEMLSTQQRDYLLLQSRLDGILALESQLARRVEETRLVMQREESSFDIVEPATAPIDPLPSGRKLLAFASLLLAGGFSVFLVLLLEFVDPHVRSLRDVSDIVCHDVCAEVAAPGSEPSAELLVSQDRPTGRLSNLYRRLVNDMDAAADQAVGTVGITSVEPVAGRSMVATNLALTRSMKGQRVLLVDADLRPEAGPRPAELLGLGPVGSGLYEYLARGERMSTTAAGPGDHIEYLSASIGEVEDDGGLVALGARRLDSLLAPFAQQRHVMVDLPPLADLELSLELAAQLGGVVIVARAGQTRRSELKACVNQLERRGIDCVGAILLDVTPERLASAPLLAMPSVPRWLESLSARFSNKGVGHA